MRLATLLLLIPGLALALIRVPQDVDSIQTAINLAMAGDTVLVSPGIWSERVCIGSGSVTICSNYLFSQDSADIVDTVLDGEFAGSILSIDMDPSSRIEVNGLTFTRGEGDYDFPSGDISGGAIDIIQGGSVTLRNIVFHNNRAPMEGAAVFYADFTYPNNSVFLIENINCYNNQRDDGGQASSFALSINYPKTLRADRLRISTAVQSIAPQFNLHPSDTLFLSDCVFSGLTNLPGGPISIGLSDIYGYGGYMNIRDLYVIDNVFPIGGGCGAVMGFNGYYEVRNLHFERNYLPNGGMDVLFGGYGHYFADSVYICNNRSLKSYSLFNSELKGLIKNLFVIGNHMGSNTYFIPSGGLHNQTLYDTSINGAIFENDTLEHALAEDGGYVNGGSLLFISCLYVDTLSYKNMKFVNNYHIDHDIYNVQDCYDPGSGIAPNVGRLISAVHGNSPNVFILDSCEFIGNRQDNFIPEVEVTFPGGAEFLGSNVEIVGGITELAISNVMMRDCDDGGMRIQSEGDVTVRNITMIDVRRFGLRGFSTQGGSHACIENILLSGIIQQGSYPSPPYISCHQNAIGAGFDVNINARISNITITNCQLPFLVGLNDFDDGRVLSNFLIYDNDASIQLMHAPTPEYNFEYSLLPVEFTGPGNIWGIDPCFDPTLGSPYLSAASPCIDAGNPDPAWNDLEDPANPGFALWPSLGGLRNDIGFTGGPHAGLLDTSWSAVPTWEPRLQPHAFTLGAPWPNPFNPVTQIPFTLARPARVRISVFNLLGQEVAVLVDGPRPAGAQQVAFQPGRLASGLYLVRLEAGGRQETRAVTLVR